MIKVIGNEKKRDNNPLIEGDGSWNESFGDWVYPERKICSAKRLLKEEIKEYILKDMYKKGFDLIYIDNLIDICFKIDEG